MSKVNEASVLFKWTTVSMKFKFIKCSLNNISQYVSMSVPVRSPRTPSSKYELQKRSARGTYTARVSSASVEVVG